MALTAEEVKKYADEGATYSGEAADLAKANGITIADTSGNDAGELLRAAGAGLATGAAVGAGASAVFPPAAPFIIAGAAIIGAIAGFFAKFKFGPSKAQVDLANEFDQLNKTIHAIVLTVPQPQRGDLERVILDAMRKYPGNLPFCLGGESDTIVGQGGCVTTSMDGVRAASQGIDKLIRDLAAQAEAAKKKPLLTPFRIAAGLGLVAALGLAYKARRRIA